MSPREWLVEVGPNLSRGAIAPVLAAVTAGAAGWLAVAAPALALMLVGVLVVLVATLQYPGWVLAPVLFLGVMSPAVIEVAALGPRALVLAGLVGLARLATIKFSCFPKHALWLLTLLALLTVSIALGGSPEAAAGFIVCSAAVAVAAYIHVFQKPWVAPFAVSAAAFTLVSQVAGQFTATGDRFAGVSGNPNRMVFGLLVAMAFMAHALLVSRSRAARVLLVLVIVLAVHLTLLSGSAQGLAGLAVLGAAASFLTFRSLERGTATLLVGAIGILVVVALLAANVTQHLTEDMLTLSGRSAFFEAGIEAFLLNPVLGTGEARVVLGYASDRSTHNSTIAIALASGIAGLALWIVVLGRSLTAGVRSLRGGMLAASAVFVVVAAQLVQQIEAIPLTWGVLMMLGTDQDRGLRP